MQAEEAEEGPEEYPLTKVKLDDLVFDKSNPNRPSKEVIEGIRKSILEFGLVKPIVINEKMEIADGEHRALVWKALGKKDIQAYIVPRLNDDIKRRLARQTLNKLQGEHDIKLDADEMALIFEAGQLNNLAELIAQGRESLENILTKHKGIQFQHEDNFDVDKALEDLVPETQLGDIWQLGEHRLICADCTDKRSIDRLLEDKKADLLLIDPPYNIGKADWDNIPDYINWCGEVIGQFEPLLKENGSFYLFHNDIPTMARLITWIEDKSKFIFKQMIIWNKKFSGSNVEMYLQGYNEIENLRNYKKMAEYILFYTFQDETGLSKVLNDENNFLTLRDYFRQFQEAVGLNKKQIMDRLGERTDHTFRWDSPQWSLPTEQTYQDLTDLIKDGNFPTRSYASLSQEYETLRRQYESQRYTFNNQKTHHSIWDYGVDSRDDHETPKPITLMKTIILHSSNENDIIFDPFLGSGSTMIACEQTNRICMGVEIDPHYCDVVVKRWEAYTGAKAVLLPREAAIV